MWLSWLAVITWWCVWFYAPIFHAPHFQKRPSITVAGPTRVGLLLECLAVFMAVLFRIDAPPSLLRITAAMALGAVGTLIMRASVRHLGLQFRIHAGLYEDHQLVRTGPYAAVRHPIYSSFLCMLLCTILLLTRWEGAVVPVLLFIIGTEIRVHSEEKLLASRFGAQFEAYRKQVPAYIPFVR
jgi:protein-S-isoprenylcysteine O-methyltransferase Ste14